MTHEQLTTPFPMLPVGVPTANAVVPAKWTRPPANGETCPFTGLRHAAFYGKLLGGFSDAIVQVSLRENGETRGTRLVFLPSIHRLLLALAEKRGNAAISDLVRSRFDFAPTVSPSARWLRAPVNGTACEYTGLTHSPFYHLLDRAGNAVAVAQLKLPGESRASRLVWVPSLHAYLVALAKTQADLK